MKRKIEITLGLISILLVGWYAISYPFSALKTIEKVSVVTPSHSCKSTYENHSIDYKNDCLHPCIRCYEDSFLGYKYWMVQSPYYAKNNQIENPILYRSNDYMVWNDGVEVAPTPISGYNSDPCIFRDSNRMYVFWRECCTALCDSLSVRRATVGVSTTDGVNFTPKKVYLVEPHIFEDREQCPILIKKDSMYFFYSVWYEYEPDRKMIGIAIWQGSSLCCPNFNLTDTIRMQMPYVRDRLIPAKRGDYCYIPTLKKYDLWHFDLFEWRDTLYMVSCSEGSDNIMLSYATDGVHFVTNRIPLVNSHAIQGAIGYHQIYYKPTAFVENDTIHLFFTANDPNDKKHNILFHACY